VSGGAGLRGGIADALAAQLPVLVDQVMAEAGVVEPRICARALLQAAGDISRAVSLVRDWAATLPRVSRCRVSIDELWAARRITPGFREPPGGQYLGASTDYESRLIDLEDPTGGAPRRRAVDGAQLELVPAPTRRLRLVAAWSTGQAERILGSFSPGGLETTTAR